MKLPSRVIATLLCAFFSIPAPARACLWDSETLSSEMARLPEAAKIITRNFPRHSKAFYEWRVRNVTEKLAKASHLVPLYDDLAVAQHKLGDHKAAISSMMAKEKIKPGLYETYSNLGTFYIYTGELPTALNWIDKALSINSNAHFGREKYQKWLVEWMQKEKSPKEKEGQILTVEYPGFAGFVLEQHLKKEKSREVLKSPNWVKARLTEANGGVLGMMRFADFDNPVLQEAMGDLLYAGDWKQSAYHLSTQAYLIALRKAASPGDEKRLSNKLLDARLQSQGKEEEARATVQKELLKGESLQQAVATDEAAWIAMGKDASALFLSKYLR